MIELLIVVGYLATTVLPAAWAMRALADVPGRAYCHGEDDGYRWSVRSYCQKHCGKGCWRGDLPSLSSPRLIGAGTTAGLIWPLLLLPFAAYLVAKRKPTPGQLTRRIAELEAETEMGR